MQALIENMWRMRKTGERTAYVIINIFIGIQISGKKNCNSCEELLCEESWRVNVAAGVHENCHFNNDKLLVRFVFSDL